jgi:hypothetical protein
MHIGGILMSNVDWDKYGDDLIGMNDEIKDLFKVIDSYASMYKSNRDEGYLDEDVENILFLEQEKVGDDYGYSEWEDSMKCNCSKKNKHIQDIEKIFIDIGEMDDRREIPMPLLSVYRAVIDSLFYSQGKYTKLFILLIMDKIAGGDKISDIITNKE